MTLLWMVRAAALAAISLALIGSARADTNMEAQALWQKVQNAYKAAATFSATGQYEDDMVTTEPLKLSGTFKILYSRPAAIRVDWTDTQFGGEVVTSSVFTQDGTIFLLMGEMKKWAAQKDMERALSTAAGISHGVSFAIPSLLRGQLDYFAFTSLEPVLRLKVNGQDCRIITGLTAQQAKLELTINPATYAILQIKETQVIRNAEVAAEITKARESLAKTDPEQAAKLRAPPSMPDFTSVETMTFIDPTFGATLKPEDFVYPVPDDAKKVDNLLR
jgi:hypothetical protein